MVATAASVLANALAAGKHPTAAQVQATLARDLARPSAPARPAATVGPGVTGGPGYVASTAPGSSSGLLVIPSPAAQVGVNGFLQLPSAGLQTIGDLSAWPGTSAAGIAEGLSHNMSLADWFVYQFSQGRSPTTTDFYGPTAGAAQRALNSAAKASAIAAYSAGARFAPTPGYLNGNYVGVGNLPEQQAAAAQYANTTGTYLIPGVGSGGVGSVGAVGTGPVNPGATMPGSGVTLPGGSAGQFSTALADLTHTTAGLNWSHLALWGAILAGGYIVLSGLVGGRKH